MTPSPMRRRHAKPPPKWMHDGALVWYFPSVGNAERYAGEVDGEPWCANSGTWCVHLRRMEPAYRNGRGRVAGAAVTNVSRRVPEEGGTA